MRIAGSGSLPGGDYNEEISISGSGKITGGASCTGFSIAGSGKVEGDLRCSGSFKISGSGHVYGNVECIEASISGSGKVDGTLRAGKLQIAGSATAGALAANELRISGAARVDGDISAENAVIRGCVAAGGLINAETLEIQFESGGGADAIGGSSITIRKKGVTGIFMRLFKGRDGDNFQVAGSIEGDVIDIENVTAESVTGRDVTIGPGCSIGRVLYSGNAKVSKDAEVGSVERTPGM